MDTQCLQRPIARRVIRAEWLVTGSDGCPYRAITYPESHLMYVETPEGQEVQDAAVKREVRAAVVEALTVSRGVM